MEFKKRNPVILVVSGKANCGKDTTCEMIDNYLMVKGLSSINLQFSSYIKMYAKEISGWDGSENSKPRTLLQQLGTDIIRKDIDNNFFIKRIIGDIKVYSYYFDVITISDARFPEELDAVAEAFDNVYKVRIERPNFNNSLDSKEKKHRTETALDDYKDYDYIIINDGTKEDLNEKAKKLISEVI